MDERSVIDSDEKHRCVDEMNSDKIGFNDRHAQWSRQELSSRRTERCDSPILSWHRCLPTAPGIERSVRISLPDGRSRNRSAERWVSMIHRRSKSAARPRAARQPICLTAKPPASLREADKPVQDPKAALPRNGNHRSSSQTEQP